jgi:hypothetical protein
LRYSTFREFCTMVQMVQKVRLRATQHSYGHIVNESEYQVVNDDLLIKVC